MKSSATHEAVRKARQGFGIDNFASFCAGSEHSNQPENPWHAKLEILYDEDTHSLSVTIYFGDNLGREKHITRKVWPFSALNTAIDNITDMARESAENAGRDTK